MNLAFLGNLEFRIKIYKIHEMEILEYLEYGIYTYRSKSMKWEFGKYQNTFSFQVKESPATINKPTPTPAP